MALGGKGFMDDISVLVCDDSALMRNLISRIVNGTEGMSTVGTAMNGKFCLQKIPTLKPDVILLDIEMPEMNGIQFLEERKLQGIDIPVIVLSSIAVKGASVTMKCLELGASDFITKPNGAISTNIATVANKIIENIASYGGRYARRKGKDVGQFDFFMHQAKMKEAEAASKAEGIEDKVKPLSSMSSSSAGDVSSFRPSLWKPSKPKEPVVITPLRNPGRVDVVAIGISTGGPNALREMFAEKDLKKSFRH